MSKLKESYDDYLFGIFRKCELEGKHLEFGVSSGAACSTKLARSVANDNELHERVCAGCGRRFIIDSEDPRAEPGLDPELIYCDACNEEARQWCENTESQIYP